MKRLTWIVMAAVLVLVACAPATPPTPTLAPTTEASPTLAVPTDTAVPPTLVPVALAGPQGGTSLAWIDGSLLEYVPAGSFSMGMGNGDAPQKNVSLDEYWIYKTDVTNKMYAQCVATGNCAAPAQELGTPIYTNPDYGDYPVVGVTWDMAANYCQWVQGQLPTEAQWEKAARGTNGSDYPWGSDNPGCDLVNAVGCLGHTSGVNDYPSGKSPYGLLDMAGNVFQWVNDFYSATAYDGITGANPTGPTSGDSHVIRGSSFESDMSQTLSGLRHYGASAYTSRDLGFRCVIPHPKTLAPFCQLSSYFPTGAVSTSTCQSPQAVVNGNYCARGLGYTTITIPQGATYEVKAKSGSYQTNVKGFQCSEATVDGKRIVTCLGPNDTSATLTVCNAACGAAASATGATQTCDPGYTRDATTGACLYTPVSSQPTVAGCPVGYNLIDRGGQKVCAIGLNQNGQCPIGLYFDSQYGACVPPSGSADAPYGINNSSLAAQTFQGCAPGYNYDQNYQCCQANTGGAYPGCPLGFTFDSTQNTCVPEQIQSSGPGCVTVDLNIAKCSEPIDFCSKITSEAVCLRNTYACAWDDKAKACNLK
jgi:formylglycine-generating enzyme required for sulfatase activity